MKRTSIFWTLVATAILSLSSCAPQAFVIKPEMRGASKSGINLVGKSIAVVYLTDGNPKDDAFNASMASGFATRLEGDYFGGNEQIGIFKMESSEGADYSSKDTLVNLVMESGKDVVFLFDIPMLGDPIVGEQAKVSKATARPDSSYSTNVAMTFATNIYVYDSMDKGDKVLGFTGNKSLATEVYSDGKASRADLAKAAEGNIPSMADKAGYLAANSFLSTWVQDEFFVVYYDGAEKAWNKGAEYAYSFQWQEAIEQWMTLINSKNSEKRACAAYNIALGCFMAGQPGLALEWLDRSDKDTPVSLSKSLRSKIKQYSGL